MDKSYLGQSGDSFGSTAFLQENMRKKVKYMGGVAAVNIGLNLILIPQFGSVGAAVSTIISEILLLTLYVYAAKTIMIENKA